MNTIPLHQLPDKAYIHTLRSMQNYDQLVYSLCSKNTKEAIKSLNLEKGAINIYVDNSIELEICCEESFALIFYIDYDDSFPNNQIIAREDIKVVVDPYGESIRWESNFQNFGLKEYLHHFCEVLRRPKICVLLFSGENLDESFIEPIQKSIEGFQIEVLSISDDLTPEFAQKALESFSNYEDLYFDVIPCESHKVYEMDKYLIQNLMLVSFPDRGETKIDQVLVSNSEEISLRVPNFSEKDLNRFLKLWVRGSNPRLKYFYTVRQRPFGRDSLDMNLVLKGIKSNQIPLDSEEVHRRTKLAGGYRIWSFNGTTAVIMPRPQGQFELIVE
ncbi:hypothetical protein CAEBREN_20637 [Caenorhabditis brenneri]|uniref:Uncharacterized protein n=1 Tax=Caenorhabditis brenneri TaxID=135651 RepID=G0NS63_CAEBE|nr:hypothetical protein CAEBREN_20637 [Caenorhabditis brenneri]